MVHKDLPIVNFLYVLEIVPSELYIIDVKLCLHVMCASAFAS